MAKKPNPIATGFTAITPYLRIKGAREAIKFYKAAFGAEVGLVMDMGGKIGHAELTIGGAKLTLADEFPDMGLLGPQAIGGTSVTIMHYCKDTDATMAAAVKAGALVKRPAENQFWGARMGELEDPFGHRWMVQTQIEDVSDAEMHQRMEAMMTTKPAPAAAKKAKKPKA